MYHLGPAVKVFVDGRTGNLYDDAHMRDVMKIGRRWPQVFARWNVQYAITQHGEVDEGLAADAHWSLVFFDDAALVFVRNDGPNAELARRLAYRELLPPFATAPENDPVRMARMEAEAQRVLAESPDSALPHILRGRVRALHHDLAGFESDMKTAIRLDPSRPEPWQRLGLLALGRHQPAEAVRDLGRALELRPRQADIRFALAAAHWAAADRAAARETLRPLAVGGRTLDELVAAVARGPTWQPRVPSN
jgi:tetratricopeptide (TPR) repeat protein